jgi:hypothetical protein
MRSNPELSLWKIFRDQVIAQCRDWIIKHYDEPKLAHDMYRKLSPLSRVPRRSTTRSGGRK